MFILHEKSIMINSISENQEDELSSSITPVTSSAQQHIDDVLRFFDVTVITDEKEENGINDMITKELEKAKENKEELDGAHIIYVENMLKWRKNRDYGWIDDAKNILLKNPSAKIILMGMMPKEVWAKEKGGADFVLAHANVVFLDLFDLFGDKWILWKLKFKHEVDKEKYLWLADEEAKTSMVYIRHTLQGIKDPYHPQNESESMRLQSAFKQTQECFPWLDTLDKMLDFVLHVNIDLPEKMKGQRIEGVYCDVDGTLIEYVGIHSGKEWTQQLRQSVVELLKKYEKEWKQIYIRTWGNVEKKAAYLKTLGITRPVLNKYDYAGANAEIVVDDTDQNAFIVQSKIYPETYIDTKDRE